MESAKSDFSKFKVLEVYRNGPRFYVARLKDEHGRELVLKKLLQMDNEWTKTGFRKELAFLHWVESLAVPGLSEVFPRLLAFENNKETVWYATEMLKGEFQNREPSQFLLKEGFDTAVDPLILANFLHNLHSVTPEVPAPITSTFTPSTLWQYADFLEWEKLFSPSPARHSGPACAGREASKTTPVDVILAIRQPAERPGSADAGSNSPRWTCLARLASKRADASARRGFGEAGQDDGGWLEARMKPKIQRFLEEHAAAYDQQTKVLTHFEFYGAHINVATDGGLKIIDWENIGLSDRTHDFTSIYLRAFHYPRWQEEFLSNFRAGLPDAYPFDNVWPVELVLQSLGNLRRFTETTMNEELAEKDAAIEYFLATLHENLPV